MYISKYNFLQPTKKQNFILDSVHHKNGPYDCDGNG